MVHCDVQTNKTHFPPDNQEKTIIQKTLPTFSGIFWSHFPFQYFFQLLSGIRSELSSFSQQTCSDKLCHANQVGYPSYTSQQEQVLGCRKLTESLGETGTHANNYDNTMAQIRDRCNKNQELFSPSSSTHFVYFLSSLFLTQIQGSSLSPGVYGPYCQRGRAFQKSLASAHTITQGSVNLTFLDPESNSL